MEELYLLLVLDIRQEIISVNFIMKLSKFIEFNIVITVVDFVFKRVHFVPTYTTVIIEDVTRLFLLNVWKLHGLLTHVVLDRRLQFIALFIKKTLPFA